MNQFYQPEPTVLRKVEDALSTSQGDPPLHPPGCHGKSAVQEGFELFGYLFIGYGAFLYTRRVKKGQRTELYRPQATADSSG